MSFLNRIKGTLTEPKATMEEISQQPMIEEAVIIVGIYAIFSAVAAYIQSYKFRYILEGLDTVPSSIQPLITASTIVFALIGSFIMWFIVAGVIHLLSMAAGGEGKFYPQLLTLFGFSMLPLIFNVIISIGLFSMIEPLTINISFTDPTPMKEMYSSSSFVVSGLINLIFEIWSTIILYFAILSAHKISKNSSAIIVAIPIAFSVISLLLTFRRIGIL